MNWCPVCDGEAYPLGNLGKLAHFRCRDCGMDFHKAAEEVETSE